MSELLGGGAKGTLPPPLSNYWGGGAPPLLPTPMCFKQSFRLRQLLEPKIQAADWNNRMYDGPEAETRKSQASFQII